jgi:hypothetical protein
MLDIRQGCLKDIFKSHERIVLFGAGSLTSAMFEAYRDFGFEGKVDYIIDNDKAKDGRTMTVNGKSLTLISVGSFSYLDYRDYILLIMPVFFLEIVNQIKDLPVFDKVVTYIYPFLMSRRTGEQFSFRHTEEMRIPKTIHYCWFGGKPIPEKYRENIASWKKYCPDYEIIEWNESNYDVAKNRFMQQAYQKECWPYVTDYARKDIIYENGGIYFDTDVEVLHSLDNLLFNDFFVGMDDVANINTGAGFGAAKGNSMIQALRDDYEQHSFVDESGRIIGRACGVYETALLVKHGYKPENRMQRIHGGCVLPREVLCPISWIGMPDMYTENTLTAHKYDDLLINGKGAEAAAAQRKQMEALVQSLGLVN